MASLTSETLIICVVVLIAYLKILWRYLYKYAIGILYEEDKKEYEYFKTLSEMGFHAFMVFKMDDVSGFDLMNERIVSLRTLFLKYTRIRLVLFLLLFTIWGVQLLILAKM